MTDSRKDIVKKGYDEMAEAYTSWAISQSSPRTRFTAEILSSATTTAPFILELGCGAGLPISRMVLDAGARLIGNDISSTQIGLAKASCPDKAATFIAEDMLQLSFPAQNFDGVVAFFSIIHLPREEQRSMFEKVYHWMKKGSLFAFNLSTIDQEEMRGEFCGKGMFWSGFGTERSLQIVREVGFEVVKSEVLDAGEEGKKLDESDPDYGIQFLWVVVRRP